MSDGQQTRAEAARQVLVQEQRERLARVATVMLEERVAPTALVVLDPVRGQAFVPGLARFEELAPGAVEQATNFLAQLAGETGAPSNDEGG